MHPAIIQLLDLHRINQNRQLLQNDRLGRSSKRQQADAALEKYKKLHEAADPRLAIKTRSSANTPPMLSAAMRKSSSCVRSKWKLKPQGISRLHQRRRNRQGREKLREESLENLQANVDELKASADKAAAQLADIQAKYDKFVAEHQEPEASGSSQEEVERIYAEKRQGLDAKFLEVYERLIAARHKTPLLEVNPATRATPLGQIISHNDCVSAFVMANW